MTDRTQQNLTPVAVEHSGLYRAQLRISEHRLLLIAGDLFAIVLAILVSLVIWAWVGRKGLSLDFFFSQLPWFFVLPGLWLLLANANDFYTLRIAADRTASFQRLIIITAQLLLIYVLIFFFSDRGSLPRLFIFYYATLSFFLIGLWRAINPMLVGRATQPRRALIIGANPAARMIIETLGHESAIPYDIRGIVYDSNETPDFFAEVAIIETADKLLSVVEREDIRELIITSMQSLRGETFQAVMDAYTRGVSITPLPILYERITGRVPVEHVGNNWFVVLPIVDDAFSASPMIKRVFDILLAGAGLALFSLIFPILALLILLDSPGGVFYTQSRVGRNGQLFKILKLRTMIDHAEANTGAIYARKDDQRVTRVGRWLRKTRLDELPQFLNVIRGEMSVVGPRPERPEHVQRLQQKIPFYRARHIIRPGLTGWAQTQYGYGASDEDAMVKLQYDLYYIRHQSLLLDLDIILRTVGRVLRMSGR